MTVLLQFCRKISNRSDFSKLRHFLVEHLNCFLKVFLMVQTSRLLPPNNTSVAKFCHDAGADLRRGGGGLTRWLTIPYLEEQKQMKKNCEYLGRNKGKQSGQV